MSKISKWVPLMKNIEFHKLIAKVIGVSAIAHIIAHFMNYTDRPNIIDTFGYQPWITGGIITMSMMAIFSAAHDAVRHGNFQIFWWNHHMFVFFFGGLLGHAMAEAKFLRFGSIPLLFYVIERMFRIRRGSESVYVMRIKYIKPVLEIRFKVCTLAHCSFIPILLSPYSLKVCLLNCTSDAFLLFISYIYIYIAAIIRREIHEALYCWPVLVP